MTSSCISYSWQDPSKGIYYTFEILLAFKFQIWKSHFQFFLVKPKSKATCIVALADGVPSAQPLSLKPKRLISRPIFSSRFRLRRRSARFRTGLFFTAPKRSKGLAQPFQSRGRRVRLHQSSASPSARTTISLLKAKPLCAAIAGAIVKHEDEISFSIQKAKAGANPMKILNFGS
jgi:hypothetical protein